jgi:hypothetical protein
VNWQSQVSSEENPGIQRTKKKKENGVNDGSKELEEER